MPMNRDLDAATVAARLDALRARYVPERVDQARARLARVRPASPREPFERAVARRLAELAALCDLARHLQSRR
jgi:hypothetical protein